MSNNNTILNIHPVQIIPADPRSSAIAKLIASVNALISIIIIALSIIVVRCTIKYKKLHTTCHLLLALYFICYIFFEISYVPPAFLLVNPWIEHVSVGTCAIVNFVPTILYLGIFTIMPAISLDRLLCILFPIWYNKKNVKLHMGMLLILIVAFPLYNGYVIVKNVWISWNNESMCAMNDLLGPEGTIIFLHLVFICFVATICFYAVCLLKMWWQARHSNNAQTSRQSIIKALLLILAIQILQCILGIVSSVWMYFVTDVNQISLTIYAYSKLLIVNLLAMAEVPVLYFCSTDHRKAIQEEFKWLFNLFKNNTSNNSVMMAWTTYAPPNNVHSQLR